VGVFLVDHIAPLQQNVVMQAKKQLLAEYGLVNSASWADFENQENKPLLYELVQKNCGAWLDRVGQKNGFEIVLKNDEPQLQVNAYEQNRAGKRDHNIRFSTVEFSGDLRITNPDLFQQALF